MRLNRKQKIVRNLLACLGVILAIYVAAGFPPWTVEAMCERERQTLLLPELRPVFSTRYKESYSGEWLDRTGTLVIARCGTTYYSFTYRSDVLRNERRGGFELEEGSLCMGFRGMLYAAGDFGAAHAARAVVHLSSGSDSRDFPLEGERLGEEVFGFRFSDEDRWVFLDDNKSPEEMELSELSMYWYRTPSPGGNGYSYDHADVPVTITLLDEGGNTLDTLELTVDTYAFHTWH